MSEYIEREITITTVLKALNEILDCHNTLAAIRIANRIREIPVADVVDVKHGEWIACGDGEHTPLMCSSCLNTWSFYKQRGSAHCPNCGAKMDGATDTNVGDKMKEGAEQ